MGVAVSLGGKYCDMVNNLDLTDSQKDDVKDLIVRILVNEKSESLYIPRKEVNWAYFVRHNVYKDDMDDGSVTITLCRTMGQRNQLAKLISDELDCFEGFMGGAVGSVSGDRCDEYTSKYKYWDGTTDPCVLYQVNVID